MELNMYDFSPHHGLGTLVSHFAEGENSLNAHVTPIYQTSTFGFSDVASGKAIYQGEQPGYVYTRLANPNAEQFASKVALLEAVDLLRTRPGSQVDEVVAAKAFTSGMAAISSAILARAKAGETIIAQEVIYSNVFNFLQEIAPRTGINVVWVKDTSAQGWEAAFRAHPQAVLAYAETPSNPTMLTVDLAMVAEIAHRYGAWLMVDNTFATPYCQRPLSLGAEVVVHSTTKFLSGHGVVVGGVVVSRHLDYVRKDLQLILKTLGGCPSPFDAWLANLGLKTFELRMQRHCQNAMAAARYLESHPKVAKVHYPGLESHPGHVIAKKQMHDYGGMISFELKDGLEAGTRLMNNVRLICLAVSLGTVESLIQHPASMTHSSVPAEERLKMGISDGLVRFSVGLENTEDILADLEQALAKA
jgi:methionine-gamma-lyase